MVIIGGDNSTDWGETFSVVIIGGDNSTDWGETFSVVIIGVIIVLTRGQVFSQDRWRQCENRCDHSTD